jgi:Got1/Sft2-like family
MDGSSTFDYRSLLPTRSSSTESSSSWNENDEASSATTCTNCFGYELPPLSWKERCIGCATCMIGGYLLSLGSFFRIFDLLFHHNPYPFVINATIGNIIALTGSCFFSGPQSQMQKMFHTKRRTASIMYLSTLVCTLLIVVLPIPGPKGLLLLFFMLIQYVAVAWYCLSYIPYAHETIRSFVSQYCNGGTEY